ncbi:MAG: hypothetical protein PPHEINF_2955 [uncultured Paraburkholderia sp.]|nr:MAG: hypothetical protein PPHEINF_2955 [uncultured Paraburkholderia sp.]CAH2791177.1 MAG: hypothetical protein PPHEESC_3067 [uncultured Paraburkholderia sp.]CAH2925184.1 MAG: hypothetical protein PPHEMADMSA_2972 [uncultured Paraburkholderia sp.]
MRAVQFRSVALAASAANASRQKTRKSAFGRFFFRPRFLPARSSLVPAHQPTFPTACGPALFCTPAFGHFLPSREGFNYNTGHFGAG